jgi:hypothetical protein
MEVDMANTSDNWQMPRPSIGDIVLFSTDIHNFSNPVLGFVIQEPGDSTVRVLTFTPHGWVDRPSTHHKDDPQIHGDHAWDDLGVWQFAPITEAVYKGAALASKEKLANVGSK